MKHNFRFDYYRIGVSLLVTILIVILWMPSVDYSPFKSGIQVKAGMTQFTVTYRSLIGIKYATQKIVLFGSNDSGFTMVFGPGEVGRFQLDYEGMCILLLFSYILIYYATVTCKSWTENGRE